MLFKINAQKIILEIVIFLVVYIVLLMKIIDLFESINVLLKLNLFFLKYDLEPINGNIFLQIVKNQLFWFFLTQTYKN